MERTPSQPSRSQNELDDTNKENHPKPKQLWPSSTAKSEERRIKLQYFKTKTTEVDGLAKGLSDFTVNPDVRRQILENITNYERDTAPKINDQSQDASNDSSTTSLQNTKLLQPNKKEEAQSKASTKPAMKVKTKTKALKTPEEEQKESIEYLQKLCNFQEAICKSIKEETHSCAEQIEKRTQECEEWQKKLNSIEEELKAMNEEFTLDEDSLLKQIENMEKEVREYQETIEQNNTQISLLESKIQESDQTIKTNQDIQQQLIKKNQIEQEEIKILQERSVKTQEEIAFIEKQYSELDNDLRINLENKRFLNNQLQELKGNIRVYCRIRPELETDLKEDGDINFLQVNSLTSLDVIVPQNFLKSENNKKEHNFNFEHIFDQDSTQEDIFVELSQLIQSSLDGYNVCIFAYGQTGSGKTFTMEGDNTKTNRGMIPRSVDQIFNQINYMKKFGWNYQVHVSFQEIYIEQIRDLLSGTVETKGEVSSVLITTPEEFYPLFKRAKDHRAVAETQCNEHSSRSHSIFQLKLKGWNSDSNQQSLGTLNLIDLAGSERLTASKVEGERLKETQAINKSLTALGDVITALANKEKHIPYRNSKLTFVLQNYLGGDSKTLMFVNLSPLKSSFNQTLCSLRFAAKASALLIYRMLYFVARTLTFPGSLWLLQRDIESSYAKSIGEKLKLQTKRITLIVKFVLRDDPKKIWNQALKPTEIKDMLLKYSSIFTKLGQQKKLTKKQKQLSERIDEIMKLLGSVTVIRKVSLSTQILSFWDILDQNEGFDNSALYFKDRNEGQKIMDLCQSIDNVLVDIIGTKKLLPSFYRWLTDKTLGSLDEMRVHLAQKYDGKEIKLRVARGVTLDCMLLFGESSKQLKGQTKDSRLSNPTILFCNPNAAYYEVMHLENEWADFYLKKGINMFVWNYRGYGRSDGKPNPNNLKSDGESIIRFLRNELGIKKLGVHGESIGGLVACHLAKYSNIDFVCADRTFSSLIKVASSGCGAFVGKLYLMLTGWSDDSSKKFADAKCSKILTFDRDDEIIKYLPSLKYGVTYRIAEKLQKFDQDIQKSSNSYPNGLFSWLKSLVQPKRNFSGQYNRLLRENETQALFYALKRIQELFLNLPEQNYSENQQSQIPPTAENNHNRHNDKAKIDKSKQKNNQKAKKPKNSGNRNNLAKSDIELIDLNESKPKEKIESDFSIIHHSKKTYANIMQSQAMHSNKFKDFISRLYNIILPLEAGGVFLVQSLDKIENFKEFLLSLEIWGTFNTLTASSSQGYHQKRSIHQIKQFLEQWKDGMNTKLSLGNEIQTALFEDLEIISGLFTKINLKLNSLYAENFDGNLKSSNHKSNSKKGNSKKKSLSQIITYNEPLRGSLLNVGQLLPLTCGHNGNLSDKEMHKYEEFFKFSGFLKP